MQETQVQALGWVDPLKKEMATHSSILAWEIPQTREAWRAIDQRVTKSQTQLKQLNSNSMSVPEGLKNGGMSSWAVDGTTKPHFWCTTH